MTRLICFLMLCVPLAAQVASQDIVTLFGGKRGLVRSGMAAAVQTGSANLLQYSNDLSNAAWTKSDASAPTATTIADASAAALGIVYQQMTVAVGSTYVLTAEFTKTASASSFPGIGLRYSGGVTQDAYSTVNTDTGVVVARDAGSDPFDAVSVHDTGTAWRVSVSLTNDNASNVTLQARIYPSVNTNGGATWAAATTGTATVTNVQLNPGSTALPYVATTDLQSIASLPPGTATITRGANSGASTDDPQVSLAGWNFDSGDRVSGLPAKGANWTTTNCSGVECYTITSAGTEYVNGEARRNLLRWSEDFSNAVWTAARITKGANTFTETVDTGQHGAAQAIAITSGTYTVSADVKPNGRDYAVFYPNFDNYKRAIYNVATCAVVSQEAGPTISVAASTDGYCRIRYTHTAPSAITLDLGIFMSTDGTTLSYVGDITKGVYIRNAQLERVATATTYQKTTDSREWALETPGNYVGLLTWWDRWDRLLGPGEVYQNYMRYWRPQINAKGGTLP